MESHAIQLLGQVGLLLALLGAIAACGEDPTGAGSTDVSGQWHIVFPNMSGSGVSCSSASGDMSLSTSGATFSGTYGPIILSCTSATGPFQDTLQGAVVNGTLGVNAVSFDLDTPAFHQTGTTNGCIPGECEVPSGPRPTSFNGTAHWTIDRGGGQAVTLDGNWSAARQ
ncbi:MAG: hypothetical protein ACJ8A6_13450 [Gemmatimonadales bacterium]